MNNSVLISYQHVDSSLAIISEPYYIIMLFSGKGIFSVDFVEYNFDTNTILFLSPYQNFKWVSIEAINVSRLEFHGDYYCIEFHKNEVACNGLLFNNVYLSPFILVTDAVYKEILSIFMKIEREQSAFVNPFDAVIKTYLQLILALCSKEKLLQVAESNKTCFLPSKEVVDFQMLLENNYLIERCISFYAEASAMSPNAFSKKIKLLFGKTPSRLVQDRVVLEAKKLLHLTRLSIKEIAAKLHFEDEFYFSRYFKKNVGVSPAHFRLNVGISIVAKKSM